jgi:hypothetical protein
LADFVIFPAIISGLLIGIYEALLIHRDVRIPTHRFGHMVHAFIIAIIATFISFNVPFTLSLLPFLQNIPVVGSVIGIRVLVGLIMLIKIHGVSAALKSTGMAAQGMKETWTHSFIVAALTVLAPYVWPLLAPLLPELLR